MNSSFILGIEKHPRMNEITDDIFVLIPSYDRPEILRMTLPRWLEAKEVGKVLIMAQASSEEVLKKYEEILRQHTGCGRVVYKLVLGKLGSAKARNALLDWASACNCKYVVMADDDHLLLDENCLARMIKLLKLDEKIGAIGGRVITKRLGKDPDFFLNMPMNLADLMTKLTGYVFLDVKHGPRRSEFLPSFFALRREVLDKGVRYEEVLDSPTGFREESDFQLQIRRLDYGLLYDPRACVIHLVTEGGGNRPKTSMAKRMYWKSLTHAVFIMKWNRSTLKRTWYLAISTLILSLYRIWHILWVFKGMKDGVVRAITRSKFHS
jgi:GT2 family glycosyltransferase